MWKEQEFGYRKQIGLAVLLNLPRYQEEEQAEIEEEEEEVEEVGEVDGDNVQAPHGAARLRPRTDRSSSHRNPLSVHRLGYTALHYAAMMVCLVVTCCHDCIVSCVGTKSASGTVLSCFASPTSQFCV